MANVVVHPDWEATLAHLSEHGTGRVFAFTGRASTGFHEISYQPGDALLLGPEPDGLPDHLLDDVRLTELVRIPMQPSVRSLNLANAASIAVYEAWRQHGYHSGV